MLVFAGAIATGSKPRRAYATFFRGASKSSARLFVLRTMEFGALLSCFVMCVDRTVEDFS